MATCGEPSGSPIRPIGWQINNRQLSRLRCLRVATTLPATRARSIGKLPRANIQHPEKHQIPNSKFRINPKPQNTGQSCEKTWCLELGALLELGGWSLELSLIEP